MSRLYLDQINRQCREMWDAVYTLQDKDRSIVYEQARLAESKLRESYELQDKLFDVAPKMLEAFTGHELPQLYRLSWLSSLIKLCENAEVYKLLVGLSDNDGDAVMQMINECKELLLRGQESVRIMYPVGDGN